MYFFAEYSRLTFSYWDVEEYLSAGTYTAYLFVDGVMIGEQSVTLN